MAQCPFFPQSTNNQTLKMGLFVVSSLLKTFPHRFRNGHQSVVFDLKFV